MELCRNESCFPLLMSEDGDIPHGFTSVSFARGNLEGHSALQSSHYLRCADISN